MRTLSLWTNRFPHALSVLKDSLASVPRDQHRVFGAFLANSGLAPAEAEHAIALNGSAPLLWIADLGALDGRFARSAPGRIMINSRALAELEANDNGTYRTFAEAKILHELVHWARFEKSISEPLEMGREFEIAAYDSVLARPWPERAAERVDTAADVALLDHSATPTIGGQRFFTNDDITPLMPRGIRNNNPGNVKRTGTQWQGLAEPAEMLELQKDETVFCVFKEAQWGIRAMARILTNYQRVHGLKSVAEMIERWAPAEDANEPKAYGAFVAERMGITPDGPFSFGQADLAQAMVTAIISMENGVQPYAPAQIAEGIALARTLS